LEHDWILYIAVFATAFGLSLFATPYAKTISIKLNAIDYPKKRGMHKDPIPRMGGVAIIFGFMLSMLVIMPFMEKLRSKEMLGFIIGAVIIAILGMLDDIKNLSPKKKLCVQIIAAMVVIFSGTKIEMVHWPFPIPLEFLSGPITLAWIIGVTNAVNLIDGLDGLAAGVSSIGALCLMILCIMTGSELAVILTAGLAGSCLGFLPRNFNPAEVIMGDTGSTFLGFVLAVTSIIGVFKTYTVLAVLLCTLALALPIFDTLFAMIRRLVNGKPIMQADRGHIHHRLIDSGLSQIQAVFIIYGISITCAVASIVIAMRDTVATFVTVVIIMVFSLMFFVYRKRTVKH
jgi:UDP-GlcNAc:undecaprenyl-phosphate GlcNAc-1-phosphate transferase